MTSHPRLRRFAGLAVLLAAGLALAGCLLSPGKFTSALDIRKDGRFSFSYTGEIHLLALSKLADMGRTKVSDTFTPKPCLDTENYAPRPCTAAEIADQQQQWQQARDEAEQRRKRDVESTKVLMGDLNPADPSAAVDIAQRLRRQAGWRRVDYKGDGLFDVDFAISGQLSHDFAFPTVERLPFANAFVQLSLRSDGTVRMDAPGFGPNQAGGPYRGMMEMAAASAAAADQATADTAKGKPAPTPALPLPDGTFTLRTNGEILSNNTEAGPQADTGGKRMEWTVNPRSQAAPMALIQLDR